MTEKEFLRRVAEVIIGAGQEPNWDWLDARVAEARKRGLFEESRSDQAEFVKRMQATSPDRQAASADPSDEKMMIRVLTDQRDKAKALLREMDGFISRECSLISAASYDKRAQLHQRMKEITNDLG